MESIIEFYKSNQWLFYAVFFSLLLVIFYKLCIWFAGKSKNSYLNHNLDNGRDKDEYEPKEKKPGGRFFIIEGYHLPNNWEETFDVIVDRETHVQYLNYGVYGITPLIDSNGKPILYKGKFEDEED